MVTEINFEGDFEEEYKLTEWNLLCMKFCLDSASLSKCASKQVSSVIANDDSIFSVGVNGTFPGKTNCNEIFKKYEGQWYYLNGNEWVLSNDPDIHHKWSLLHEVHAEMNALAKVNKKGIVSEGLDLYCNYSPCYNCTKSIIASGIKRVFYNEAYDDCEDVKELFESCNVDFIKVEL